MIKAILFDADGVVIVNDLYFSQQLERDYGISTKVTGPFFVGDFQKCMTGKADLKEELAKHLLEWGWQGTVNELLDYWFKCEHTVSQELIDDIQKLRKKGIKCYLATNQEKHRTKYIIKEMGFGSSFDGVFSSAHLGHQKPNEEFFRKILAKLPGILPKDIMFWDDKAKVVEVAQKLGFDGRVYTTYDNFRSEIKELL